MPYKKYSLPSYPVTCDVWDRLKSETRPIVVYGMGNGADKLFRRFSKYGICPKDVFASDGFVRGHSYRGIRVKSFSEIKEMYPDFVIAVSFATKREEVISLLSSLDEKYDLYLPDMPVAESEVYFDRAFYNENYQKIKEAYELFEDEDSKNCYAAAINYKLTGKISYLLSAYSSVGEMYSLFDEKRIKSAIDVGAYNGDTVKEINTYFPNLESVIAIEPDTKNFKKLSKYAEELGEGKVTAINAAAHGSCGEGELFESGNRNSSISSSASYEHKSRSVKLITVDSLGIAADYVKYDVEGNEYEALLGSDTTIKESSPELLISLYHKSRDIFSLPIMIKERYPNRKMLLRRGRCLPAWEINLIVK